MDVAVAFDHRGVKLRERVLDELAALGHETVDLGTDTDAERIDYPDKARELGEAIQAGGAERGVLVCGSGVGASVAACKLAGIRAAICHDVYSAHQGVEHDDMNVLCLGSEVVGPSVARELVAAFLNATFDGGERYVAMEVEPGVAYDTEKTFEQARWIAKEVDRPNLMVKIPATMPGLPAIEDSTAHGTSINITLIFSLERYKAVVEAYIRGLEGIVA